MAYEPAHTVISRLGGLTKVSALCGVNISTVQRWKMPREKGGTGGLIPAKYMTALLRHANESGASLTADDMIPKPKQARAS